MIGQKRLKSMVDNLIENEKFPRFSIILGCKGSGKKEMCKYIAESLNVFWCYEQDNKIDTIRKAIIDAYKVKSPTCYVFTDVDDMSIAAKNALLKVTEEPPNNAYFIMTIQNLNTTLPTIKSRAQVFDMDPYSPEEILSYAKQYNPEFTESDLNIIKELCIVPGDVEQLDKAGAQKFYDYVEKVVDNIAEVSGSNAFKLADSLALKESDGGYDVQLFLRAFTLVCLSRLTKTNDCGYAAGISITSRYLSDCGVRGVSKKMLVDNWILDIRKEWM